MDEWVKWILGIAAILIAAGILAVGKLLAGKANKTDVDNDLKVIDARINQFTALFASAVSKTDLMKDLGTAAARGDDRDLRVQKDITELKADMKATIQKISEVDKKLDELPSRVRRLEETRDQK